MFKRLIGSFGRNNRAIEEAAYREIVAAARQPEYYSDMKVPDTPLGRFEMISLHMILFLHRLRGQQGAVAELAQDVTDIFFTEVDHSLRELGIGDISVPKRMKKLAKMFYGRAESYGNALDNHDLPALEAALARNIRPDADDWEEALGLAEKVMALHAVLADQEINEILQGQTGFGADEGA